jgi:Xaa-Pro dipeptidase
MSQAHLDVLVIPNNTGHSTDFQANVRWLTHVGGGSDADVAAVFPLDRAATAFANQAAISWHPGIQNWTADVRDCGRNLAGGVVARLHELGIRRERIGISGLGPGTRTPMGTILRGFFGQLTEAFPAASFVDTSELFEQARFVKSDEELDVLQQSEDIIEAAIDTKIRYAKAGAIDWQVWAEVMSTMLRRGSELPFHNQWFSGKHPNHPITRPSNRRLERGDLIVAEIEASVIGYRSQAMQPVFVEQADFAYSELFKLQREVWNVVNDALCPGATLGDLAVLTEQTAERLAPRSGPAKSAKAILNMHGRGQGDDGPIITPSQRREQQLATSLESNMVFVLKPFIRSNDGAWDCTWGDTVVVSPKGGRRLGRRPHELVVA